MKRIFLHLALAALVLASLACIGWVLVDTIIMPRVARQGWPIVAIPSLEGMSLPDAQKKLEESQLQAIVDPVRRPSDHLPPDAVVFQQPGAGDSVKQGHLVRIWLSAGPSSVRLPELVGRDSAEAVRLLKDSELGTQDTVEWRQSPMVPGKVVATQPKPGTILSRGSKVLLILSAGDSTAAAAESTATRIF